MRHSNILLKLLGIILLLEGQKEMCLQKQTDNHFNKILNSINFVTKFLHEGNHSILTEIAWFNQKSCTTKQMKQYFD